MLHHGPHTKGQANATWPGPAKSVLYYNRRFKRVKGNTAFWAWWPFLLVFYVETRWPVIQWSRISFSKATT